MSPRQVALASLGGGILIALACATSQRPIRIEETVPGNTYGKFLADRPECPQQWDSIPLWRDSIRTAVKWFVVPPGGFTASRATTDVPEFNDCQQFITSDGAHFQQLVAIFAAYKLDSVVRRIVILGDSQHVADSTARTALPTAEIFNYGVPYEPLGIASNFNCLFMSFEGSVWRATMVPMGEDDPDCIGAIDLEAAGGKRLKVIPKRVKGADSLDYPPVARWDRDRRGQYYIGIKCGNAWCEVGDSSFTPTPAYFEGRTMSEGAARVLNVKGWYDEQELAIPDAAGDPMPSGLKGTVVPDPELDRYAEGAFLGNWLRTSYVAFDSVGAGFRESLAFYRQKFLFGMATVQPTLGQMNEIQLCQGTRDTCNVPNSGMTSTELCGPDELAGRPIYRWWARMKMPPLQIGGYRCVTRRIHPELQDHIPGTARWRWTIDDETVWERCTQGCCEVTAKRN